MLMQIPAIRAVVQSSAAAGVEYLGINKSGQVAIIKASDWDESKHKRAENGQFGSGGGGDDSLENFSLGPSKPKDRPKGPMRLVEVKLDNLDSNMSQAISHHVEKLVGSSPDLKKVTVKVKSRDLRDAFTPKGKNGAYAVHDIGTVTLNDRWFGDDAKFRENLTAQVKSGYHPVGCDTPESVVTHEMGHLLFEQMDEKGDERSAKIDDLVRQAAKSGELGKVSRYAMQGILEDDLEEAKAEIFASIHHTPESDQQPLVKEVAKILGTTKKAIMAPSALETLSYLDFSHLSKSLDYSQVHTPRLGGSTMEDDKLMEKEDDEQELEKEGSDLDFVKQKLQEESGGVEALSQALENIKDPKLKEILTAIHEDEAKHQAALEQYMQENGGGSEEGEEEGPGEEEAHPGEEVEAEAPEELPDEGEELDKDEDGGKGELIDQIRAVLEAHETEKADEDEPEEEDLGKENSDEEETEKSDDEDDKPDFLKEDEDEEEPGKITKSFRVPIMKGDRQIVYGVVSEPNSIDLQGDRLSESEIRKACHKFMQTSQKINKEHEGPAKADIIESYIAPTDFKCGGQMVRKGSWVMAVKVKDPDLWQAVKKGEITGFSIAGQGERVPFD